MDIIDINCAQLLADWFLHAYEADVLQGIHKIKDRNIAQSLFCFLDLQIENNN